MSNSFWACPFCALHCDDLVAPKLDNKKVLNVNKCIKASKGLSGFNIKSKQNKFGYLYGQKEIIQNLTAEASKVLFSSQSPFFGGLGLDILGSRSVIKLAQECNATIDHMHGDSISAVLRSFQAKGTIFTTLSEIKSRADLIIFLKSEPNERLPRFAELIDLRNKKSWTIKAKSISNITSCDFSFLEGMRSILNLLRNNLSSPNVDDDHELVNLVRNSSYCTFVWDPQEFGELSEYIANTLMEIVKEINQKKRAGILTLGSDNGGLSFQNTLSWMTAKSIRSKFSTKSLHYQPELFSLKHCLELKTIDSIFWFSSFSDSLPDENVLNYPFVAIGPESMGKKYSKFFKENKHSIFIPIATPGVNSNGYIIRCDGAAIIPLKKLVDDKIHTVEKLISQIIDNM
ncbi:hypothetical protein N9U60_00015 [Betaproteobacteria bacterium]|nr:hypothetical protein [Betaproteobacteria bacterium]